MIANMRYSMNAMEPSDLKQRLTRLIHPADPAEEPTWQVIAKQVIAHRHARELTQHQLAELCATTQSAIARIESGLRPPRIDTLLRIAHALDCDLDVALHPRTVPPSVRPRQKDEA